MVPQGPPTPAGGSQSVPPSLLRSNSGLLGGQGGGMTSQNAFSSLVSPRNQFSSLNMLGNVSYQSFGNGGPSSGPGPGSSQRGLIDANTMSTIQVQGQQHYANTSGSQMMADQQSMQQLDSQNFQQSQQQLQSMPGNTQQQFQASRPGLGPVKMEPQTTNEQAPQALRNLGPVKLESQQLQNIRSMGPVKLESQHSDPSLFLQQQQQQQLLLSRQSSQAAAAAQILHQQRLMQFQHQQQQQQLLKAMPQQRSPLQPQFTPQSLPIRSPVKPVYEPGMCARRLTHYMYQQQHRPDDNSIEFWRKFVAEYFAPNAKKKWCVSMYGSGRQTTGVFPQDVWHCEICNCKPGRGFEATAEVLPRLFKIKYESGTLEELLYVDMPREYQNSSGQIVLDYAKAIQESVFEQLRVVRDGQLRIVFSPDLKICSWEFCARRHEELIPRRLLIPQVSQLGNAAQKYQAASQNASPSASISELQNNCNMFVASARQLAKALEVPLVNDLGYTKRYVRCLQISEVVNSMKDLIDYSRETGAGPMESLAKFPRNSNSLPEFQNQSDGQLQQKRPQTAGQNSNGDNSVQAAAMQLTSTMSTPSVNNAVSSVPASSTSTIVGLLHQNSMNSRQQNPMASPYGGNSMQMPSPGSSNTPLPASHTSISAGHVTSVVNSPNVSMQQPAMSGDAEANDSQSSVQKIIHDMIMSPQFGAGGMMGMSTMGGEVKNINGMLTSGTNGVLVGSGVGNGNNPGISGSIGNGRAGLGHNSLSMNGRIGMTMGREQQQQDVSNQLLNGLDGFNSFQFDWKSSP